MMICFIMKKIKNSNSYGELTSNFGAAASRISGGRITCDEAQTRSFLLESHHVGIFAVSFMIVQLVKVKAYRASRTAAARRRAPERPKNLSETLGCIGGNGDASGSFV
ncbi:hypothetical protein EYF80_033596 [Liparis tanakae]|uniref:Uncharacterized protein n=1 Tax=Liparis tanakae TaxID=230148 RepID=A0A4Z2GSK2_9TELE|nr:hypothetical protein EYF80_033596 [Liparis tanakae]